MNQSMIAFYRMRGTNEPFDYHAHEEYEIYFFHSGTCRYLIHNQIYDLEPGDILIMDGMTLHKPNVHPNSEYIRSAVHFSPKWVKSVLEELGAMYLLEAFQRLHHCLIRTKENEESKAIEKLIQQLSELSQVTNRHELHQETELKVLLLQVLISVYNLGQKDSKKLIDKKSEKAEHVENVLKYIQAHYMEKLTVGSIAEALNLSKSYVSHLFREMTGFTVMEYVMASRLTQVKYLLEMEPKKSIKDIAIESGFESASHFSRYFREHVGMTAGEFRRKRLKIYSEENG
ncbi:helix-turn-helix transcriptional regulator [Oceanobacillus polygoni]|uniref:AraC-like DNA-binding protein n=1 Tax=Oceanobacillus polygoni TaxID=1235259 RepID=A0A9X0YUG2_9BACI|nr:AraC family transcriptional regulator [Oceanobacillus polygoni]MBP2079065.1 AraC-like DNA-binding protein [Oceanobacillus polygoni]